MKLIRYFVNITFVCTIVGALMLINDLEFDVYAFWNVLGLGAAVYYMNELKKHES